MTQAITQVAIDASKATLMTMSVAATQTNNAGLIQTVQGMAVQP